LLSRLYSNFFRERTLFIFEKSPIQEKYVYDLKILVAFCQQSSYNELNCSFKIGNSWITEVFSKTEKG
jgi:hypothetical protein